MDAKDAANGINSGVPSAAAKISQYLHNLCF